MANYIPLIISVVSALYVVSSFSKFASFLSTQLPRLQTSNISLLRLVLWDVFLVLLFWIQHVFMASRSFKNKIAELQISHFERTIYVATSAFILQVVMSFWEPVTELYLWYVITIDRPVLWLLIYVVQAFAWIILILELLVMDPLELLGIKQIYFRMKGYADPLYYKSKALKQLYQHVRHPGMLSLCLALWVHPLMTYDRMILAIFLTLFQYYGHNVSMQDYFFVRDHFCYSYRVEVTETRKIK